MGATPIWCTGCNASRGTGLTADFVEELEGKNGAEGGTRTPTSYLTRPSNVRVCQFRHFGMSCQITIVTQTVSLRFPV